MQNIFYCDTATAGRIPVITATQFELIVADHLAGLGKDLPDFRIKHNTRFSAHDGVYQIDVLATYTALV